MFIPFDSIMSPLELVPEKLEKKIKKPNVQRCLSLYYYNKEQL